MDNDSLAPAMAPSQPPHSELAQGGPVSSQSGRSRPVYDPKDPFDFDPPPVAVAADEEGRPEPGPENEVLKAQVLDAIRTVRDPEIPANLVDLGLIYDLIVRDTGKVYVEMTLTTPACPVAGAMPGDVEKAIRGVEGVSDVQVKLVWSPPWHADLMSEEARLELGFF